MMTICMWMPKVLTAVPKLLTSDISLAHQGSMVFQCHTEMLCLIKIKNDWRSITYKLFYRGVKKYNRQK